MLAITLGACLGSGDPGADPVEPAAAADSITLSITTPAVGGTLETPDESVSLAGTAESNTEVVSVSWTNDQGGEGQASGNETWKTETIPLEIGENTITITAKNSAGATASLSVVVIRESETAGSVTLSWTAPTMREDGTPLTDLAGYYIRYGRMSEIYDEEIKIENPGVVSYVVEPLSPGTWYFVAIAYDGAGVESSLSNEVSLKVP